MTAPEIIVASVFTWIKMAACLMSRNSFLCKRALNQRWRKMILRITSLCSVSCSCCRSSSFRNTWIERTHRNLHAQKGTGANAGNKGVFIRCAERMKFRRNDKSLVVYLSFAYLVCGGVQAHLLLKQRWDVLFRGSGVLWQQNPELL